MVRLWSHLAFPVFLPKPSSLPNMVKNKGVCVCVILGVWGKQGAGRPGTDPHGIKPGPHDPAPLLLPVSPQAYYPLRNSSSGFLQHTPYF